MAFRLVRLGGSRLESAPFVEFNRMGADIRSLMVDDNLGVIGESAAAIP